MSFPHVAVFPGRGPQRLRRMVLEGWQRSRTTLSFCFAVGDRRFRKRYIWHDVDLAELERRHGRELLERLYFHLIAFEAIPMAALRPQEVDFGPLGRFLTPQLGTLWRRVLTGVGAQWRYRNRLAREAGPVLLGGGSGAGMPVPASTPEGPVETLLFSGGGKDSLVAMRLLERAGISYASLAYSHSTYGDGAFQHRLIDDLGGFTRPERRHRFHVEDELWDDPEGTAREFGVTELICAETPISIFAALPLALQYGYRFLVLGNERSADVGNLVWAATGEEINHQWGKSFEAERLINEYLGAHLLPGVSYWSLLKPLYDVVIFQLLREEGEAVRHAHSCSVRKPWCERCPKCAYVGAGYLGHLREAQTAGLFRRHPLALDANLEHYRGLLGLGRPKPFDCVGEIGETQLALALCRRKGFRGGTLDLLEAEAPPLDLEAVLSRYLQVDFRASGVPDEIEAAVGPLMRQAAEAAGDRIRDRLS